MATMNTAAVSTTMTRKEALSLAIERVKDIPECAETLSKMLTAILKEGSKTRAASPRTVENGKLTEVLLSTVLTAEPMGVADVVTRLAATVETAEPVTQPRVVSLLTKLVNDGKVVRSEVKRKAYYALMA